MVVIIMACAFLAMMGICGFLESLDYETIWQIKQMVRRSLKKQGKYGCHRGYVQNPTYKKVPSCWNS